MNANLPEQQGRTNDSGKADDRAVNPAEGGDANNADGEETTVAGQRRMQTTQTMQMEEIIIISPIL